MKRTRKRYTPCPTPEQSGRSIWWGRQRRASHWTAGPWFVDGTSRSEMSRWNSLSIPPKLQLRAKSGSSFTRGATESKEPGNGGQIWIYESMSPQSKDKKDWRFGKDSDTVSTAAVSRQDLPSCQKGCLSAMEGGWA